MTCSTLPRRALLSILCAILIACPATVFSQDAERGPAQSVTSKSGVVAADNVEASRVGAAILAAGGNAADAGAATLLANGILNPFASGFGGGGFCLYRPEETGKTHVIDFRERAPLNATADMFLVDGEPSRELQLRGGLAVGIPGEPAGLWALQQKFGALEWEKVVDPAVDIARDYKVGPLLAKRLRGRAEESLKKHPTLAALFQKEDGQWVEEGDSVQRSALADTLALYRDEGPIAFYHGPTGQSVVEAVNAAGGIFQAEDLSSYSIATREAISGTYHDFTILSMPPPSSGGLVMVETLNILEHFKLDERPRDAHSIHLIIEALKHGFADRARWMGDADFVEIPGDRFTSKEYAKTLAAKIKAKAVLPLEQYGSPIENPTAPPPDDSGTSHLSIIDAQGNMLACTSSVNTGFGSMVYDPKSGILLNNHMGDFTAQAGKANNYGLIGSKQNEVAPQKRPLSSMTPTLVLRGGQPYLAVGGSGGPTIISGTLLTMINLMDFKMSPAEAIAVGRVHAQWRPEVLFTEPDIPGIKSLEKWGHRFKVGPSYSSVQIVIRNADGTQTGVSDPRKLGGPAAADATAEADAPSN